MNTKNHEPSHAIRGFCQTLKAKRINDQPCLRSNSAINAVSD
ncbi:hypothetical protein AO385_0856 [Moraxella catarrhalis]|uniref:Uncharacterized protein n=1 Tax=Moraxella catarrhalis TaxID=480 RepID=A0A198UJK4_MORCA|nr:hypothetical protein AO384_1608 [Moraxella catarrhalis]OAU98202.1 hypothetical protein AO383_0658 [Moraxella catarrhalis]OAV02786.1 hypothetical protein AO385_0856 [Moraxella catarrhalis]